MDGCERKLCQFAVTTASSMWKQEIGILVLMVAASSLMIEDKIVAGFQFKLGRYTSETREVTWACLPPTVNRNFLDILTL